MTIKEFAGLCGCTAQTLRYYDRIDLLKPERTDPWTGYRYYAAEQTLDFVRIKNLQAADFSIGEIRTLLAAGEAEITAAFRRKIAAQMEKLRHIREIYQSYLAEKSHMEQIAHSMTEYLLRQCRWEELREEFGLTAEEEAQCRSRLRAYFDRQLVPEEAVLRVNGELTRGAEAVTQRIGSLTAENTDDEILLGRTEAEDEPSPRCVCRYERWGWAHIREALDGLPPLSEGGRYWLRLRISEERRTLSCALLLLAAVLLRQDVPVKGRINCACLPAEQGGKQPAAAVGTGGRDGKRPRRQRKWPLFLPLLTAG